MSAFVDQRWIWHPNWTESRVTTSAGGFVHFRKCFNVEVVPQWPVLIHISADTRYKLYVNSHLVSFGPVKGDEHLWFYDELDLLPYLRQGENHVAIRVLRFYYATSFAPSFPRLSIGGLLIRNASPENEISINGDSTWECAVDLSSRLPVDIEYDQFLHVYEMVDRRRDKELKWVPAVPQTYFAAFGIEPPWMLSPRLIPFQRLQSRTFKAIHNIQSSVPLEDWKRVLLGNLPRDRAEIKLAAQTQHHLELEVEHHMTALLSFRFANGAPPGSELKITYSECYEDSPKIIPYFRSKGDRLDTTKRLVGPKDQYIFGGVESNTSSLAQRYYLQGDSEEIFSPFHFRTLRFIALDIVVADGASLIFKGIDMTENHYPLQIVADIQISTEEEKTTSAMKLWRTSIRTLQNCMHDCYEDCPFYEQLQYSMDMRASALFTYNLSGDDRLARQAIIQHHNSFQPGVGLTAGRAPSHQLQNIPHFSLYWICMLTDHYEYYGDANFIRRFLGVTDAILETFNSRIDPHVGLVGPPKTNSQWDFVDWADKWKPMGVPPAGSRTGFQTFTSLLFIYTLKRTADLLSSMNRSALAAEYETRAEAVSRAVREHCYDGQFFTDGLAKKADLEVDYSQHNQIWAVLSGILSGCKARDILNEALGKTPSKYDFTPPSIAMRFYSLRALAVAGGNIYNEHFHSFWNLWREQLEKNVTTWVEDSVNERSDCHAWGSAPLFDFTAEVAGIKPARPGWTVVSFKPRLSLFTNFDAKVPIGGKSGFVSIIASVRWKLENTNHYKVSLSIERTSDRFDPLIVQVILPGQQEQIIEIGLKEATFQVVI